MLTLTLLLLLLSNSITLIRDKSILYSRVTITILVISSLITYDDLTFLFLNKGIGIFGGLFHTTSTTSVFHKQLAVTVTAAVAVLVFKYYTNSSSEVQPNYYAYVQRSVILIRSNFSLKAVISPLILLTQAFFFYWVQYYIPNLNAFMLIIAVGYSSYCYVYKVEHSGIKTIYGNQQKWALHDPPKPYAFSYCLQHSSMYNGLLKNILKTMCKYLLSICNNFILNKLTLYCSSIVTILFEKYPFLYNAVDYIFTIRDIFNLYLTVVFSKLEYSLEKKYPVIYAIIVYLFSEYTAIMKGKLTRNVFWIITFYVIYSNSNSDISIFILLLSNGLFKQFLEKNTWIKHQFPVLYTIFIEISTIINICLILYFLDSTLTNIVIPAIKKLLGYIIKMTGEQGSRNSKSSNNSGGDNGDPSGDPGDPGKDNRNPLDNSQKKEKNKEKKVILTEKELSQFYQELAELKKHTKNYEEYEKKNNKLKFTYLEFSRDYTEYLPEKDKENLRPIEIVNVPQDIRNVHSYWTYKKKVNKEIYKHINSGTIVFEQNSKTIQDKLGGRKSTKSAIFRRDLDSLKSTYSNNFRIKDRFLNERINSSSTLDKLIKKQGIDMYALNYYGVII